MFHSADLPSRIIHRNKIAAFYNGVVVYHFSELLDAIEFGYDVFSFQKCSLFF